MNEFIIETKNLIITPLSEASYVNVTKLFVAADDNCLATGVFGTISEHEIEKRILFDKRIKTGFNFVAYLKKTNQFAGYFKGYITDNNGLWINMFIIVPCLRRNGYGSEFIYKLTYYFRTNYNISFARLSVIEYNTSAKKFWVKLNFRHEQTLIKSGIAGNNQTKIEIYAKKYENSRFSY